jgi:hypothetical protein
MGAPAPAEDEDYDQIRTEGMSTLTSESYAGKPYIRQSEEDAQPTRRWWVPSDFEETDHSKDAPRTPERGKRKAQTPETPQTEVSFPYPHPEEDKAEKRCFGVLMHEVAENKVARRVLVAAVVLVLAALGLAMYAYFRSRNESSSESNVGQIQMQGPAFTTAPVAAFTTAPVEIMVPSPPPTIQQTTSVTGSSFQPTQATAEQEETGDPITMNPSRSPVADRIAPTNGPTNMPTAVPTHSPSSRPTVFPTVFPTIFPTAGTPAPTIETPPPSEAPMEESAKNEMKAILLQASPDSFESLDDVSSPQYRALDWLLEDPLYSTYSGARVVQRWAMATFFFSTNGNNWDQSDNWLGEMNECSWFSKRQNDVCDGDGNVRRIELDDNNLGGTLPAELSLFSDSLGTSIRTENSTKMTSGLFSPFLSYFSRSYFSQLEQHHRYYTAQFWQTNKA